MENIVARPVMKAGMMCISYFYKGKPIAYSAGVRLIFNWNRSSDPGEFPEIEHLFKGKQASWNAK